MYACYKSLLNGQLIGVIFLNAWKITYLPAVSQSLVALDPKGLPHPWKVTQTYRKAPHSRIAVLYLTLRQECVSIPWVNFLFLPFLQ